MTHSFIPRPDRLHRDIRCPVAVFVPAGRHLIGLRPQNLFRVERIELGVVPGLSLLRPGPSLPFDGTTHVIEGHDRTLCIGALLAFEVENTTEGVLPAALTLIGSAVDDPIVGFQARLGFFVAQDAPDRKPGRAGEEAPLP